MEEMDKFDKDNINALLGDNVSIPPVVTLCVLAL